MATVTLASPLRLPRASPQRWPPTSVRRPWDAQSQTRRAVLRGWCAATRDVFPNGGLDTDNHPHWGGCCHSTEHGGGGDGSPGAPRGRGKWCSAAEGTAQWLLHVVSAERPQDPRTPPPGSCPRSRSLRPHTHVHSSSIRSIQRWEPQRHPVGERGITRTGLDTPRSATSAAGREHPSPGCRRRPPATRHGGPQPHHWPSSARHTPGPLRVHRLPHRKAPACGPPTLVSTRLTGAPQAPCTRSRRAAGGGRGV